MGTALDPAQSQSHSADLLLLLHTFAMTAILEEQAPGAAGLLICIITSHI